MALLADLYTAEAVVIVLLRVMVIMVSSVTDDTMITQMQMPSTLKR